MVTVTSDAGDLRMRVFVNTELAIPNSSETEPKDNPTSNSKLD